MLVSAPLLPCGVDQSFATIIEPFRIHSVEPLRMTTAPERNAAIESAGFNLFNPHWMLSIPTETW